MFSSGRDTWSNVLNRHKKEMGIGAVGVHRLHHENAYGVIMEYPSSPCCGRSFVREGGGGEEMDEGTMLVILLNSLRRGAPMALRSLLSQPVPPTVQQGKLPMYPSMSILPKC